MKLTVAWCSIAGYTGSCGVPLLSPLPPGPLSSLVLMPSLVAVVGVAPPN